MKHKPFLLSDEQVNSYGFKVLTSGISLERFRKNPVMLFEHDRSQVIGKWDHIGVKGEQLTALPIFDQEDSQALSISKKVENGFINGASIGIHILEIDSSQKIPVATKTEVFETSICAIPSNSNALRIVDENGTLMSEEEVYVTLSLPYQKTSLNTELAGVLGLSSASDRQLIEAVKVLKQKPIDEFITKSIDEGRILGQSKDYFIKMLSDDFEQGKKVIECLPKKKNLTDLITHESNNYPAEWTLQDYRKYAPNYLRENSAFYKELVAKELENN